MHEAVLEAAGELFSRLRLERYADRFLGDETRAILEAYERSGSTRQGRGGVSRPTDV